MKFVADWMKDRELDGFIADGLRELEQYLAKQAAFQRYLEDR